MFGREKSLGILDIELSRTNEAVFFIIFEEGQKW